MKKIFLTLVVLLVSMSICSISDAALSSPDSLSLEKLLTGNDEENAIIYFGMASTYSDLKDHENAIKYFTKVIELKPKFVPAYVGRAKNCGDIQNWQCSLDDYEKIKEINPADSDAYFATSVYKLNIKDFDAAMVDIDKAISMTKKPNATYYTQKAWVYLEMKDYDNAFEYLRKSLKINSNDAYSLGLFMYIADENEDYNMVIKIARKLLKVDPAAKGNHVLYSVYAKALYKTGKEKQAVKQLEKAIEIEPSNNDYPLLRDKILKKEKID